MSGAADVERLLHLKEVPNPDKTIHEVIISLRYSSLVTNKLGVKELVEGISEVRETASAGNTLYVYFERGVSLKEGKRHLCDCLSRYVRRA